MKRLFVNFNDVFVFPYGTEQDLAGMRILMDNIIYALSIMSYCEDIELYVCSKSTKSKNNMDKINELLDCYMPFIDSMHRLFLSGEQNKKMVIPRKVNKRDFLLDSCTSDLLEWETASTYGCGSGIKLVGEKCEDSILWYGATILVNQKEDLDIVREILCHLSE